MTTKRAADFRDSQSSYWILSLTRRVIKKILSGKINKVWFISYFGLLNALTRIFIFLSFSRRKISNLFFRDDIFCTFLTGEYDSWGFEWQVACWLLHKYCPKVRRFKECKLQFVEFFRLFVAWTRGWLLWNTDNIVNLGCRSFWTQTFGFAIRKTFQLTLQNMISPPSPPWVHKNFSMILKIQPLIDSTKFIFH